MKLIRRYQSLQSSAVREPRGRVVTVGAFDGVHLGHVAILGRLLVHGKALGLPSLVMSFEPTPKEFLSHGRPPARLTRFREKFAALAAHGIDQFFCPRFSELICHWSAEEFVVRMLVEGLAVKQVVVGDDFRFGQGAQGDVRQLEEAGRVYGFGVETVSDVVLDGQRVSSTAIRQALGAGELGQARALLGRDYSMSGRVVRGNYLGRKLGFPTANVNLKRLQSPVMGIFAVCVSGLGEGLIDGVANVGTRPTIGGQVPLLEVFLFDFDRNIYGEYISVHFIARLRDELKFPDLDSMVEQMHLDVDQAKAVLAA